MKLSTKILATSFLVLKATLGYAASNGTEAASFLDIPVGAGPAALGSAYSSLATDAYAPVYNPAGLGFVHSSQIAAQHLSYLESIHYEFGSVVVPLGGTRGALGLAMQYLGSDDFTGLDANNRPQGDFSAHYAAYSLSYGRLITSALSFGLTGKIIEGRLADVDAKAFAGDVGALYKASDKLSLSATVTNLGSHLTFLSQNDSLPMTARAGAAYAVTKRLKVAAEGVYNKTGLMAGHFGAEWSPLEAISLRGGYKTETTEGLSFAAGLTAGIGLHLWGQEFSYAWLPYGDLGDTQYFSFLLKFGDEAEARRNLIQYQSIKMHQTAKNLDSKPDVEYEQLMQLLGGDEPRLALGENHHE